MLLIGRLRLTNLEQEKKKKKKGETKETHIVSALVHKEDTDCHD